MNAALELPAASATFLAKMVSFLKTVAIATAVGCLPLAAQDPSPVSPEPAALAPAADPLAGEPDWQSALAANRDGLAEVAVISLSKLAARTDLPESSLARVRSLLAENLIRSGEFERGLQLLPEQGNPLWRGLALAGMGRLSEAAPLLATCALDPDNPHREHALLSLASSQVALGEPGRAVELLSSALKSPANLSPRVRLALAELLIRRGDPQAASELLAESSDLPPPLQAASTMLRGHALLAKGEPESAKAALREVLASPIGQVPPSVMARTTLLLADALTATGSQAEAVTRLRGFIETAPEKVSLLPAFDRLQDAGGLTSGAEGALLAALSESSQRNISRAARYFKAKLATTGRERPAALKDLAELSTGTDPVAVRSKLLLAESWIEDADKERALAALKALKESTDNPVVAARVAFVEAKAHHSAGEFKLAADRFAAVADVEPVAQQATFNAALAALRSGDEEAFLARSALLPEVSGDLSRGSLQLERALYKASLESDDTVEALEAFLREHPDHPQAGRAYLALASAHILAFPPKAKSATAAVENALALDLDASTREQADYIAFWIEESSGEAERATKLADTFIEAWPKSPLAPEIRMRQAEIHYRNGDFLDALLNFERVFADYPESELAPKAMFFAGRSAMLTLTKEGSQRALMLWQKLAEGDSPFAALARRHQAQMKLRQGNQSGAIALLDAILEVESAPVELRISALLLKGEALFVLGSEDEANFDSAIKVFEECLTTPGIATAARNEALFRKGKAHESLGQTAEALKCFHDVVSAPRSPLSEGEAPEFLWFYRAGFEAIRMLDARGKPEDIRAAITIADTLAASPGPRAAEARKAAEQIRLENFIWEE